MEARIQNPALSIPGALESLQELSKQVMKSGGVSSKLLLLVDVRASQINGCSVCVDMHTKQLKQRGESDERLNAVAAWRDAPYFSEAERAVLELTEAATRSADGGQVSDEVWAAAAEHFDEPALAALVMQIGTINLWNRLNLTTRQVAGGEWN